MELSRIRTLREALEAEAISYSELSEIEEAFAKVPDEELGDFRENATAKDMLDALEGRVSLLEWSIYHWVSENFGENEANDPSWSIGALVEHLNNNFEIKEK